MQCPWKMLAVTLLFASPLAAQEPSRMFIRLDRNSDGKVSKEELPRPIFDRIDANADGFITPDEDRAFARRAKALMGQGGAAKAPDAVQAELDLPYASTDNPRQRLDLYLPKERAGDKPLPVVAFIHGGAWQNGDKRLGYRNIAPLVESGDYAVVSIGYRLSGEAIWPAQIHDCKAAIRWLKGNAKKYNLDPDRIGVTGNSAGGHLVAMLGTSGDVASLAGELGDYPSIDARVVCVVDQFGPTDLLSMGHNAASSPESRLIGGPVQEHQDTARAASPTTYVSKDDPPFLLIHGTDDPIVPFSQSEKLHAALRAAGVESTLVPVAGAGHGNFQSPEVADRLRQFFDKHLRGKDTTISDAPIKPAAHD